MMHGRENDLLRNVYETGFALDDIILYLDTHPCDEDALAYYKAAVENYKNAKMKYEEHFGPLTAINSLDCDRWAWADTPLPWEGGR